MNKILAYTITGIFLFSLAGCSGQKTTVIKGIADRELPAKNQKHREQVDARAYNHFINGSIFEILGEIQMANRQYAEALKYYPKSDEIRLSYASTFAAMHDFKNALNEAMKISPRNLKTWKLLADCYAPLGMVDSLVDAYNHIIMLDTMDFEAYYRLGLFYQENEILDSALWAFQNVARISPSYRIYSQLATLQIQAELYDEAEQSFIRSLEIDSSSNNIRSYLGLAAIYEFRNDMSKMKEYLRTAADLAPEDLNIQNRILAFYQRDQEFDKAIEIAKRIDKIAPNDLDNSRRLGIIYYQTDSLDLADSVFADLIDGGDTNIAVYYYAGRTALLAEDYEKSIKYFNRLTSMADSIIDGWLNLGLAYRLSDTLLEKETAVYENGVKYMKTTTDSAGIYFAHGVTLERHGKFDAAVEMFEKVIALQPGHSQALNYLGYMLADKGVRLDYARDLIERALAILPESGAYLDSYGWVLFRLGEKENALDQLLQAYDYVNDDPTIIEHIGDVYEALGDTVNAEQYWRKALEFSPENESLKEKLAR